MSLSDEPPDWPDIPPNVLEEHHLQEWYATLLNHCPYDPSPLVGVALGMFHCPVCGCMILAGVKHPPCDPADCWITNPGDLEDVGGA